MSPVPATVLVTGASRGIGLAFVRNWATHKDVRLIFAGARNLENAEELKTMARQDQRIHLVQLDVEEDKSIKNAYDEVCKVLDKEKIGLNLLINNAGILGREDGVGMPHGERNAYMHCLNVNTVAPMLVTQTFLPLLKRAAQMSTNDEWGAHRAAIVNISSGLGSIGDNTTGSTRVKNIAYRLSKAALNQLTKTLSIDLADDGIIAISFCPGFVKTDMTAGHNDAAIAPDESTQTMIATILALKKEQSGAFMRRNGDHLPY